MKIRKLLLGHGGDKHREKCHQSTSTWDDSENSNPQTQSHKHQQVGVTQIQQHQVTCVSEGTSTWERKEACSQTTMVLHSEMSSGDSESLVTIHNSQYPELSDKDQLISDLQREMSGRDRIILQQRTQLDEAIRNLSLANKTKAFLTSQLSEQDRKMAVIEQQRDPRPLMREQLNVAHEALTSLRKSFRKNDPNHHTLDTLEQTLNLLMERLHIAQLQKATMTETMGKYLTSSMSRRGAKSLPSAMQLSSLYTSMKAVDTFHHPSITKVVYFTDQALTPSVSSIPKKLGEITLRDFKIMLDMPGSFRYHFKSMDPEFGIVKEEVLQDDDILPGMEEKIIAWVEGEHHT